MADLLRTAGLILSLLVAFEALAFIFVFIKLYFMRSDFGFKVFSTFFTNILIFLFLHLMGFCGATFFFFAAKTHACKYVKAAAVLISAYLILSMFIHILLMGLNHTGRLAHTSALCTAILYPTYAIFIILADEIANEE